MSFRTDMITVELFSQFLYPGVILKGDGYDESNNKVIDKDVPLTEEQIKIIKNSGIKKIHYSREKLRLKKDLSSSMIAEQHLEKAVSLIEDIRCSIKLEGTKSKLPVAAINELVGDFISDIKGNSDAYLNLLDLYHMDDYNYTHSINVATIAVLLGVSLNVDELRIKIMGISGLLHDIGKTLISDTIIDKPDKLNDEEWKVIKNHPVFSYNIIHAQNEFNEEVEKSILCHHENYNGGGYPFGLNHDKQTITSHVVSIADVFDAATSKKPYKQPWSFNEAFTFCMENSGRKFNPTITQIFLRDMAKKINEEPIYPEDCYVLLNTGEIAWVVGHRVSAYTLRPIVNIFLSPQVSGKNQEQMIKHPLQIDLEGDYKRFVIRRITDVVQIQKFNLLLNR